MVTDWKFAMLCLLPLMWEQVRLRDNRKIRTWAAMMGASVAAAFSPSVVFFTVIDILAAAIVLKRPACTAQRMIGLLFVGMIFFELGFLISEGHQQTVLVAALSGLGWMQFAILAAWGSHDAIRYCLCRLGIGGGSLASERRL